MNKTVLILIACIFFEGIAITQKDSLNSRQNDWLALLKGNSWNLSLGYTKSGHNEGFLELGRTFGSYILHPLPFYSSFTYGLGVNYLNKNKGMFLAHLYCEINPWLLKFRVDYLIDPIRRNNYLRPSVGLSFLFLDVFYNYTFSFDERTSFHHGITFKVNLYYPFENWNHSKNKLDEYEYKNN